MRADVSDPEDVERLFQTAGEQFGGLDVFVSNAALGVLRPAMELTPKYWQKTLDVMGRAFLLGAQCAAPLMEGRWGRIIAISSIGSFRVLPNYVGPGVAKATLETLTRYLAVELAPRGISVNTVSGGVIETDALDAFPNQADMLAAGNVPRPVAWANPTTSPPSSPCSAAPRRSGSAAKPSSRTVVFRYWCRNRSIANLGQGLASGSSARSARSSPTAGANLKPWPEKPAAITTRASTGWRSITKSRPGVMV